MEEKVGSVTLDLSRWDGADSYSDGEIERELLERLRAGETPLQMLEADDRYPVLYHFSPERGNVVRWYPFPEGAEVLEVGAGMGAVTGALCDKARRVTALDLSRTRSLINAWRNRQRENLDIVVSNIENFPMERKFDVVTLIGVLEYAGIFFGGQKPFKGLLENLRARLKPGGVLLIAIENQFGLKYFSGAREDHNWRLFSGVEGYREPGGARTFGRVSLEKLIRDAGFGRADFYYPYPDYKLPRAVFSDEGTEFFDLLPDFFPNYGEYACRGADQAASFRAGASDGWMAHAANSFLVAAGAEPGPSAGVLFSKFGTGRSPKYAVYTNIVRGDNGKRVEKHALPGAEAHLDEYERIRGALDAPTFGLPALRRGEGMLEIEYIEGRSMADVLAEFARDGGMDGFLRVVNDYRALLAPFETDGMLTPALIDFTFDNLISRDGRWTAIDQEWADFGGAPAYYVLWRAVHFFFEARGGAALKERDVMDALGVTRGMEADCYAREDAFGRMAFGPDAMAVISPRYGKPMPELRLADAGRAVRGAFSVNCGRNGRREYPFTTGAGEEVLLSFELPARRDLSEPALCPAEGTWCDVELRAVSFFAEGAEASLDVEDIAGNFAERESGVYRFETFRPALLFGNLPPGCDRVEVRCAVTPVGEAEMEARIAARRRECAALRGEVRKLAETNAEIVNSTSWKITKPIRKLKKGAKREE